MLFEFRSLATAQARETRALRFLMLRLVEEASFVEFPCVNPWVSQAASHLMWANGKTMSIPSQYNCGETL